MFKPTCFERFENNKHANTCRYRSMRSMRSVRRLTIRLWSQRPPTDALRDMLDTKWLGFKLSQWSSGVTGSHFCWSNPFCKFAVGTVICILYIYIYILTESYRHTHTHPSANVALETLLICIKWQRRTGEQ